MSQSARRFIGSAAAICLAGPVLAGMFDNETLCTGELVFPNEDGSSERYTVSLAFAQELYTIKMASAANGTTTDEGTCREYVGGICHHYIIVDGRQTDDFYAFGLVPRGLGRFFYEEVWRDGSRASTVLTCRDK